MRVAHQKYEARDFAWDLSFYQAYGDHTIHGVLTHTCPLRYLPTEMFLSTQENAKKKKKKSTLHFPKDIDRSTEIWLEEIEQKLDYREWFCGHYHVDKQIDKITMMYREIRPLYNENPCSDC